MQNKLRITFLNFEHTPALDAIIERKSFKLSKFFNDEASICWTCLVSKEGHFAHIKVSHKGQTFTAQGTTGSLYKTIDNVISKVISKISRKRKITSSM